MKRTAATLVALAFVAGCSGGGLNGGNLLPGMSPAQRTAGGGAVESDGRGRTLNVYVTMRIPRRDRRDRVEVHPSTISPNTQSVSFSVNSGKAQIFNATPSSKNCKAGSTGTTCTFSVAAPPGSDRFVVTTYSALHGGGVPLNRGTAVFKIVAGKNNAPHITLGPVVSTTADTGTGSLRYAVGSANPGDTVMFMLPSNSTLKINSPVTLGTNVSIVGPGFSSAIKIRHHLHHPQLQSDVTFTGLSIDGQGTQQIFVVKAGVTATISGLILTNGLATSTNQPGGAIYNEGTLSLVNDALTDNDSQVDSPYIRMHHHVKHSRGKQHHPASPVKPDGLRPHVCVYYYGGAVYNHGNLSVTGSWFDSNVLQTTFSCHNTYGGAIYNDEYGTLVSSKNTYSHNAAYYGGAIYNNSTYGQASFTTDAFTANSGCTPASGCAVSGCSGSSCTTYPYGDGAAIYDADGPGIVVTGSSFLNNVAGGNYTNSGGYGGAMDLESGNPSISSSTFTGNLAGGGTTNCSYGEGGAIYEDIGNPLQLSNNTFSGNKAGGDDYGYGGAVYNDDDPDTGSGNTFTSNQAYGSGGACTANGEAAGGALYAYYGVTMSGSTFTTNSAMANYDAWGGAIYEDDPTNLTGNTFTSNGAAASGANGSLLDYAYGGAIYADGGLRLTSNTFTGNGASAKGAAGYIAYGGAVYMDGSSYSFISNGNTYASNSATVPASSGSTYAYGGAVFADASTFVSNGDKYTSNSASNKTYGYGGGLYNESTTSGVSNNTFTSNSVTSTAGSASGGGLYSDAGGTYSSSTFTGNSVSATGFTNIYDHGGGGLGDDGGATFNGVTVSGNKATGAVGGGIFTDCGSVDNINNSVISGNSASGTGDYGGGGGVWSYCGTNISNTTISGNSAAANGSWAGGGGLWIDSHSTVTGSTVSGNKVTGTGTQAGGGGVYTYDNVAFMNDTISNNTSSIDGGGLRRLGSYNDSLINVTIYQNTATGNGGSIFNDSAAAPYLLIANSVAAGGTAATGKDVYNTGTIVSDDYNIIGTAAAGGGTFTLQTHDKTMDPKLLGLGNNGGPTFTNADQSTSPGKAYIPWSSASGGTCGAMAGIAVDQRGFSLGAGGKCDVGAYAFGGTPSLVKMHVHVEPSHHPNPTHLRMHRHLHPQPPR